MAEFSFFAKARLPSFIVDLNQWIELRQGSKGKPRKAEETTIKTQICLLYIFENYFVSCDPWFALVVAISMAPFKALGVTTKMLEDVGRAF